MDIQEWCAPIKTSRPGYKEFIRTEEKKRTIPRVRICMKSIAGRAADTRNLIQPLQQITKGTWTYESETVHNCTCQSCWPFLISLQK